jgi:hypothetical protein
MRVAVEDSIRLPLPVATMTNVQMELASQDSAQMNGKTLGHQHRKPLTIGHNSES